MRSVRAARPVAARSPRERLSMKRLSKRRCRRLSLNKLIVTRLPGGQHGNAWARLASAAESTTSFVGKSCEVDTGSMLKNTERGDNGARSSVLPTLVARALISAAMQSTPNSSVYSSVSSRLSAPPPRCLGRSHSASKRSSVEQQSSGVKRSHAR